MNIPASFNVQRETTIRSGLSLFEEKKVIRGVSFLALEFSESLHHAGTKQSVCTQLIYQYVYCTVDAQCETWVSRSSSHCVLMTQLRTL